MANKIGPSFFSELVDFGVDTENLVWDVVEGTILHAKNKEQREKAEMVVAVHDPNRPLPADVMELSRHDVVLKMHGMGVLKAFIAAKVKATDLERWRAMEKLTVTDPVFCRMCAAAEPRIDCEAVFNFSG